MKFHPASDQPSDQSPSLEALDRMIHQLTEQFQGDEMELLRLLRLLEGSHQTIREHYFQPTLPRDRHRLYNLLREIEAEGGWPYIPRMPLRQLLNQLHNDD